MRLHRSAVERKEGAMNVTPPEGAPKGALLLMLLFFVVLVGAWLVLYAELWTRR
jgi:hypothetical protein